MRRDVRSRTLANARAPELASPGAALSRNARGRIVDAWGEWHRMDSPDRAFDEAFAARAERRAKTVWTRVVDVARAGEDDPDELASTPSERVALVDTLLLAAYRAETDHGTEPRLQRSVARLFKRRS